MGLIAGIGERLKLQRTRKSLTQQKLAEKVGVAKSTISMYEKNSRFQGADILTKLAEVLETSSDYLLAMTDISSPIEKILKENHYYDLEEFQKGLKEGRCTIRGIDLPDDRRDVLIRLIDIFLSDKCKVSAE